MKDDILLEVIIVCGTFSLDEKCAVLLVQAGVPELLITVLKGILLRRRCKSTSSGCFT